MRGSIVLASLSLGSLAMGCQAVIGLRDYVVGETGGTGGTTTTSTMCDPQDPTTCETGMGCFCGGPGGQLLCGCGAICQVDADCTDPLKPICCGGGAGTKGVCTDACTCFCD